MGTFFFVITAIAMLRFPDFYTRLHASSKCLTGGALFMLAGLAGLMFLEGRIFDSFKLLLLSAFLVLTNPATSHAIARAAHKVGLKPKEVVKDELREMELGDNL
ncbi:monovalent cation/H(+) antiporter subunit G [Natroniella sp. ANB-PHB2]|uniref:monovalent cation/H(+) antiporter subunit G n=1 Tax=Natroniella sp. ANB-PHB2 TaxID=3384444 RepID=UPI0038D4BAF7